MLIKYTVNYWDEVENCTKEESGIVSASDWNGVFDRLYKYYGKDNIDAFTFCEMDTIVPRSELLISFAD